VRANLLGAHKHTYVYTYTHTYIYIYTHRPVQQSLPIESLIYIPAWIYIHVHIHIHIYIYVYTYTDLFSRASQSNPLNQRARKSLWRPQTYIHVYMYTYIYIYIYIYTHRPVQQSLPIKSLKPRVRANLFGAPFQISNSARPACSSELCSEFQCCLGRCVLHWG